MARKHERQGDGARQYNQAWAMVQYLIYAEDEPGHPRFRSRLIDMLKLIHEGKNGHDAFVEAFSDNMEGFQHMFTDYARSMQPTPEATFIENQDVLADMLIELKNRGRTFADMSGFKREIIRGRYQVDYTRGSVRWNSSPDPAIYFRDAEGREMGSDQLFFADRNGRRCRTSSQGRCRACSFTRFSRKRGTRSSMRWRWRRRTREAGTSDAAPGVLRRGGSMGERIRVFGVPQTRRLPCRSD